MSYVDELSGARDELILQWGCVPRVAADESMPTWMNGSRDVVTCVGRPRD